MGKSNSHTPIIKFGGTVSNANPYAVPDGSLLDDPATGAVSLNLALRRPGILDSRNGTVILPINSGYSTTTPTAAFVYKNDLYLLRNATDLRRFDLGLNTLSASLITLSAPAATDLKMRGAVAGERLFLTSALGMLAIDSDTATAARLAGGPIAPGFDAAHSGLTGGSGFLGDSKQVAYRYLLGYFLDNLEVLGPVSPRFVVINESGSTDTVDLRGIVPPGLSGDLFVRVYRSSVVDLETEPDDDLRLVFERQLTNLELSQKYFALTDDAVAELRGDYIYTSPNAGEGILQSNEPPPLMAEICAHEERLFAGRTTQPHTLKFTIIGDPAGAGGIQAGDTLILAVENVGNLTFTAVAGAPGANEYQLATGGSTSENIKQTAMHLVAAINASSQTSVWAYYASGTDDAGGEVRLTARSFVNGLTLYVGANGVNFSVRTAFSPRLPPFLDTTFNLVRAANVVTATTNGAWAVNQALNVGDTIKTNGVYAGFGSGQLTITFVDATKFRYAETAANLNLANVQFIEQSFPSSTSSQDSKLNRVHWSKFREYEAWPLLNFIDLGRTDKKILAIASQTQTLWVFKEDGLFRLVGDPDNGFTAELVDDTVICIAPETVRNFDNRVLAWTNRGVVAMSENAIDFISSDIDNRLLEIAAAANKADVATQRVTDFFALAHETEGWIAFFFPDSAVDVNGVAQGLGGAWVYYRETKKWARWRFQDAYDPDDTFNQPFVAGAFNPENKKFYLFSSASVAAVEGYIHAEVIADPAGSAQYNDGGVSNPNPGGSDFNVILRRAVVCWQHGKAPMRDKRWDEVQLLFDGLDLVEVNKSYLVTFANEISTTFTNAEAVSTGNLPSIRVWLSSEYQRGQRLIIGVSSNGNELFNLTGIGLSYEVLSTSMVHGY